MAYQAVGIGSVANDGTGDPIRTAFGKTNANDSELYSTTSTHTGQIASHAGSISTLNGQVSDIQSLNGTQNGRLDDLEALTDSGVIQYVTSDQNYYVNSTTGSDSNNGRTSGTATLTIQKAIDLAVANTALTGAANIDINLADGTYSLSATSVNLRNYTRLGTGVAILKGNTSTPANVVITASVHPLVSSAHNPWKIQGVELRITGGGTGQYCIFASRGVVHFDTMRFGAVPSGCGHIYSGEG